MKSGVSGWPANGANIFLVFPVWGISVSNNISTCINFVNVESWWQGWFLLGGWANGANVCSVFPVGVFLKQNVPVSFVFSCRNLSFVVLCRTMYPLYCGSIDQGLHLSLQKDECELLGSIHSRQYVLSSVFVYILTCACHLSYLLLNLVSDVHLKFKGIKTYTGSFISLVFKLRWYLRLPKFRVLPSFHGGPCLVLWCSAPFSRWWRCCPVSSCGVLTCWDVVYMLRRVFVAMVWVEGLFAFLFILIH